MLAGRSEENVVLTATARRRLEADEASQAKREASERRDARVGGLLGEGHSYREIADMIGATRSAVAGIVNRRFRSDERRQEPVRAREIRAATRGELKRVANVSPQVPPAPVVQPIRPVHISLIDVGPNACRWPMWSADDILDDKRVCGGACDRGVYCPRHARLAYREPFARRAA